MQSIQCPNCGANVEVKNPGITMLACPHCQSTLYWDENAILHHGERAVLPPNDSRFWLGCHGTIRNIPFQTLGRLRFQYGEGTWDEWYISYGNTHGWIGEDGRVLTLRMGGPIPSSMPIKYDVGDKFTIGNQTFSVREVNVAKCVAFEGELPWAVAPNEEMNYYDAANQDGTKFVILSINTRLQKRLTLGDIISHDDLIISDDGRLEAQFTQASEAKNLQCASCGSTLPPAIITDPLTEICPACGAINNINGDKTLKVGRNTSQNTPNFLFSIGQRGSFDGVNYHICGRQFNQFFEFDEGSYEPSGKSQLYLLYNPSHGYKYLEYEDGHFTLLEVTHQTPDKGDAKTWFRLNENDRCQVGNCTFYVDCRGYSKILYIDGSFPWLATIGDKSDSVDCWCGDTFYGIERTTSEIEFYTGHKMTAKEVYDAFEMELPKVQNNHSSFLKWVLMGGCGTLLIIGLIITTAALGAYNYISNYETESQIKTSSRKALTDLQEFHSNYEQNYEKVWEIAINNGIISGEYVAQNGPLVKEISTLLDATEDEAKGMKEALGDGMYSPKWDDLKKYRSAIKDDLKKLNDKKSKLDLSLGDTIEPFRKALNNLNSFKNNSKLKPFPSDKVENVLIKWPQYTAQFNQQKNEFANNFATLEKLKQNIVNLDITESSQLNASNINFFIASTDSFLAEKQLYDEKLASFVSDINSLGEIQETIVIDLTSSMVTYRQIKVRKNDVAIDIKYHEWSESVGLNYTELSENFAYTIKGKTADMLESDSANTRHAPGHFILPTYEQGSDPVIGSWNEDKTAFNFTQEAMILGTLLWNNNKAPAPGDFYSIKPSADDRLASTIDVKSALIFASWANLAYYNSHYMISKRPKSSSSSSGYRHSSRSGSRSHGGK